VPTGLAVGLALKESRYAGAPAIRPRNLYRSQSGSPIASDMCRGDSAGLDFGTAPYRTCKTTVILRVLQGIRPVRRGRTQASELGY